MQLPLYFLDKHDIELVKDILILHDTITTDDNILIHKNNDLTCALLEKLKRRQYLYSSELIPLISIISMCIISVDTLDITYSIDTLNSRYVLLKLLGTHKDILREEDFIDNFSLFKYVSNIISVIPDKDIHNENERYMYGFLLLLYAK